jgi:hypothetical protein
MIREGGLYVLMGAKPMCIFDVSSALPETEEQYLENYPKYLRYLQESRPEMRPFSYEEYKASYEENEYLHVAKLWQHWKSKMHEVVGPHYSFVVRKIEGEPIGFFINTCSLLYILTYHRAEFEDICGLTFEPEQMLQEIEDQHSEFWQKAFASDYSKGLLFGYGPRNSFTFSWQTINKLPFPKRIFQDIEPLSKKDISVFDLKLPSICMYSLGDPILENYKVQRKEILQEFKNKDFEVIIRKWLSVGLEKN